MKITAGKAKQLIIAGKAPEGMTIGGSLDLRGTGITALPEGLTVGGWLDLSGTGITALPEGLAVGGRIMPGASRGIRRVPIKVRVEAPPGHPGTD